MSKHLGLIIGVNQYQDSTFRPLQFAENDARALAQWLVNTRGGRWSPPDVQLVQGQLVTRELIETLITQICINKATSGDVVLIYFAGHAFVDERTGEGYLALANSLYNDVTSCIHLKSFVQQIMLKSRASQVLCMIDCFQSGQVWQLRRTSPYDPKPLLSTTILSSLQQQPERLLLCSCRGNERAAESGEKNLGQFTHRLILGLNGQASDPTTGTVVFTKLLAYLTNTLAEQQKPQVFGQQRHPLILVGELPLPHTTVELSPTKSGALAYAGAQTAGAGPQMKIPPSPVAAPQTQQTTANLATPTNEQQQQHIQQLLTQAKQCIQTQNYAQAFSLIEQALQIVPNDIAALTLKAQLLGTAGRFAEASAIVDQIGQNNPTNPLAWSMRAVLLSNAGQHQAALAAIERSLELDAQNPESYAIKNNIMANVAITQKHTQAETPNKLLEQEPQISAGAAFARGLGLQVVGLVIGTAGAALPYLVPHLPIYLGFGLVSIGLAILCVGATRGAFRRGIVSVVSTVLISLAAGGILGASYILGYHKVVATLGTIQGKDFTNTINTRIGPILLFVAWLALAAVIPLLLSIIALIAGLIARIGRKR